LKQEAPMPKVWKWLLLAASVLPSELHGQDDPSVEPFGCFSPTVFYENLTRVQSLSAAQPAKLDAKGCRTLAGTSYLMVGEEDGLVKIRVFATPGNWTTSSVVYTLAEMLAPDGLRDPSAISRQ